MLIRDLPEDEKQKLREVLAGDPPWELIQDLTLEEASLWIEAQLEDRQQAIERRRRRMAVEEELDDLLRSVGEKYPIQLWKVEYLLHGEARKRFQTLIHELKEMSQVPLVKRDRQLWHQAVEKEIYLQLRRRGATDIASVVAAVLKRNPDYPSDRVREYTAYILETSAGIR
jgi:hypothetical protein